MKTLLFFLSFTSLQFLGFSQCNPDLTPPTSVCQSATVFLDANGNGTLTSTQINNGSTDNCGGVNLSISQTEFNCADIGPNTVTLTVTDNATSEIVDQQNTNAPTSSGWPDVAQTFTAGITGVMTKLELLTGYNWNQFSTLSIHSGFGTAGSVLSTQQIDMLVFDGVALNLITLATPVNVSAGQIYTFSLTNNFTQITGVNTGSNPYTGGQVINDGNAAAPYNNYDMYFKTYIESGGPNISSCTANVTVVDNIPPSPIIATLPEVAGCSGDAIVLNPPSAIDNCAGVISGTSDVSFPITTEGTTIVNWSYNDGNGNTVTQLQTIVISNVNTAVSSTGQVLTALQTDAAYQWLDCDNSLDPILNETAQTFSPEVTGNYAVEVNYNGCLETSSCYLIEVVGTQDLSKSIISFYPNPAENVLYVHSSVDIDEVIKIMDMNGRIQLTKGITGMNAHIPLDQLASGSYLLQIGEGKPIQFQKK